MHYAASKGHSEIVQLLLTAGATDFPNQVGMSSNSKPDYLGLLKSCLHMPTRNVHRMYKFRFNQQSLTTFYILYYRWERQLWTKPLTRTTQMWCNCYNSIPNKNTLLYTTHPYNVLCSIAPYTEPRLLI